MDLLAGYGSDGDGSGSEDGSAAAAPKQVATGGLLGSLPAAKDAVGGGAGGGLLGDLPPAKKQRRTFELPIKKLASKPADSDEDDDETPAPVPKSTKSGLLSFLPAPKNKSNEAGSSAYEDAMKRKKEQEEAAKPQLPQEGKKMSKSKMAAALFEQQRAQKAQAPSTSSTDDTEYGGGAAGSGGTGEGVDGGAAAHASEQTGTHEPAQPQQQEYDPNWAASWDPTNQAYYYYHTITGLTQWEPPYGFDTSAIQQQQADQEALPDELARELARDRRRAEKRGEFVPEILPGNVLNSAKVASASEMMNDGEKFVQYRSASSSYHTPMQVNGKVGQVEKRKHQITDVLAHAAKNELDFLEKGAGGRASQQKVRNRYGW